MKNLWIRFFYGFTRGKQILTMFIISLITVGPFIWYTNKYWPTDGSVPPGQNWIVLVTIIMVLGAWVLVLIIANSDKLKRLKE